MSLIIWAIHSVTLENDQWQHESTDWDVSIGMRSDIMDPLTSGFSSRHVRLNWGERSQGDLRVEHFAKSLTTSPLISWSRNTLHASFILLIFSSIPHTHACIPAFFLLHKRRFRQKPCRVLFGGVWDCDRDNRTNLKTYKNLWPNSKVSDLGILT